MNNNKKPLVSVLLPVHNCERFLPDALKSILQQSYRQIEIIAIDDKSSDKSLKVLRSIAKKSKKLRVYRNVKRYGIVVTLNRMLKRAKGDFIAFMDAKDMSSKSRIKKQIEFLLDNEGVVAVGAQCRFINDKGRIIGKSDFPIVNQLIYASPLHGVSMQFETVMVNTTIIPKDLLRFKADHHFIYSDVLMKLLPYGKFANLPQYYHYHRNDPKEYFGDLRRHLTSLIRLWIGSVTNYDYRRLSAKSFFTPLIKQS